MLAPPQDVSPRHCANYFLRKDEQTEIPGHWYGRGAEQLELFGTIQYADLQKVAYGEKPDCYQPSHLGETRRLRRERNTPGQMIRAGLDNVLRPGKSVSIMALIEGDKRLITAHRRSVIKTLETLEAEHSYSRMTVGGERLKVLTDNSLYAVFEHYTNRNNDCLLHSHCVKMNAHRCPDGVWRSAETLSILKNQRAIGAVYDNSMAQELERLDYSVVRNAYGHVDIPEVNEKIIVEFSSRKTEIDAAAESPHPKHLRQAAYKTRRKKQPRKFADLQEDWRERSDKLQRRNRIKGFAI